MGTLGTQYCDKIDPKAAVSAHCSCNMHKLQEHKVYGNTFRKVDDSPGTVLVFL